MLAFLFCAPFFVFSSLFLRYRVCGFATGYLDLIDHNYTVRCCTTYEYEFVYTCHVFMLLLLLLLCFAVLLLLPLQCCCLLLLFVIVCRVTQFVAVVYCISFQRFLSLHSNTIYFQCTLGSTVACATSVCTYKYIPGIIHPR